jgi:hypothetical protein
MRVRLWPQKGAKNAKSEAENLVIFRSIFLAPFALFCGGEFPLIRSLFAIFSPESHG